MRLCILHCGHPKTGTSSLQRFLAGNSGRLAQHGILYPLLHRQGHKPPMPWDGFQHGYAMRMMTKGPQWTKPKGELDRLNLAIETAPHDVLLLSAEYLFDTLFYHRAPKVWRTLLGHGYKIETISYLRDQPERLSSAYAQQAKTGNIHPDFEAFCDKRSKSREGGAESRDHRGPMFYDRLVADGLHDWGQHQFRPYNAGVKQHGIEADFLVALRGVLARHDLAGSLTEADAAALEQQPRLNDSDGVILVALCRAMAPGVDAWLAGKSPTDAQRRQIEQSVYLTARATIEALGIADPKYTVLTPERMLRLRERFAESNQVFARKAWAQDWDVLFPMADPATLASNDLDDTHDPVLRDQFIRALAVAGPKFAEAAGRVMTGETARGRKKAGGRA